MKCPFCGAMDNSVVDSRLSREGESIRRRRKCRGCEARFTTHERVEESLPVVVKRDGRREPFDRAKLVGGLQKACEKRPVPMMELDAFVDGLIQKLMETPSREVASTEIGRETIAFLRRIDPVAYIRFASVYHSFGDLDEFRAELDRLLESTE